MKISIRYPDYDLIKFSDLKTGDVFYHRGRLWIKTLTLQYPVEDVTVGMNVVCLEDGLNSTVSAESKVFVVENAEITFDLRYHAEEGG